jgi:PAS domain-containing protein
MLDPGMMRDLLVNGSLLGSQFLGGVIGNLVASAMWEGGGWALSSLKDRLPHLATTLASGGRDGQHHLLRVLQRAENRVMVTLCDQILLDDFGLREGRGSLSERIRFHLLERRADPVSRLCEIRAFYLKKYDALIEISDDQLTDLQLNAVTNIQAIIDAGVVCFSMENANALRRHVEDQQVAALLESFASSRHALQVVPKPITVPEPKDILGKLVDRIKRDDGGWWDLMRFAFRAELNEPKADKARQMWEQDVLSVLPQMLGRTNAEFQSRFDALDAKLTLWWEQGTASERRVSEALAGLRSLLSEVLEETQLGTREIQGLRKDIASQIATLDELLANKASHVTLPDAFFASWQHAFRTDPRWARVRSPLHGHPSIAIKDLYVDLYVAQNAKHLESAWQEEAVNYPVHFRELGTQSISVDALLARVVERAVVVGAPGAGKSTLFTWLAYSAASGRLKDYALPIHVRLREFAVRQTQTQGHGLLRHFLEQADLCEPNDLARTQEAALARELRLDAKRGSRRFLFLLDGWDEVPTTQRAAVRDAIDRETRGTITFISTRPSGIPHYLATSETQVVELGQLSTVAIHELSFNFARLVGQPPLADRVLRLIEERPVIHPLASNPYLLTLLCDVLAHDVSITTETHITAAWVLKEAIARLMLEHNQKFADKPIDYAALDRLQTIAYEMSLVGAEKITTLLAARVKDVGESGRPEDSALGGSKFIDFDEDGLGGAHFTHLRLQEYLAAKALTEKQPDTILNFSQSRSLTLEWQEESCFAAAMLKDSASRQAFWSPLRDAVQSPDLGEEVLRRVSRILASAGAESGLETELQVDIRPLLFAAIKERPLRAKRTISALLALDSEYLAAHALELPLNNMVLWQTLYQAMPVGLRRRTDLDTRLSREPMFAQLLGSTSSGFQYLEDRHRLQQKLLDREFSIEERSAIARDLGAARDWTSVPMLIQLLDDSHTGVVSSASQALGRIGGRKAAMALAGRYERGMGHDERDVTDRLVSDLADCLEPHTRDWVIVQLERTLNEPVPDLLLVEDLLSLICTVPLPHPPSALLRVLGRREVEWSEVRQTAARALSGVRHALFLQQALSLVQGEVEDEVRIEVWDNIPFVPAEYAHTKVLIGRLLDPHTNRTERETLLKLLLRTAREVRQEVLLKPVFQFVESSLRRLPEIEEGGYDLILGCVAGADALPQGYSPGELLNKLVIDHRLDLALRTTAVRTLERLRSSKRAVDPVRIFREVLTSFQPSAAYRGLLVALSQLAVRTDARKALEILSSIRNLFGTDGQRDAELVLHSVIEEATEQGWLIYPEAAVSPEGIRWTYRDPQR